MNKKQLFDALNLLNDDAIIKGTFSFDYQYSSVYSCNIDGITLSYSKDNWEAVIYLEQEKATEENDDSVEISPAKSSMTKGDMVSALSVLDDDNIPITAIYKFKEPRSTKYKADICGLKLVFEPDGMKAILEVKELPREAEAAA